MWQPGWERGLGENGFMYMCGWVPLLSTWNYPNVVNWRYSNIKLTAFKTVTVPQHSNIRFSRGGMTWLTHWHMHPSLELKEYAEMNRSICWQCVNFAPKKKKSIHLLCIVLLFSHSVMSDSLSPRHVRLFVTPWTAAHQAFLSFTVSWSLHELMSTESMMPSNHLIFCHPLLLLSSIFSSIKIPQNTFSTENLTV